MLVLLPVRRGEPLSHNPTSRSELAPGQSNVCADGEPGPADTPEIVAGQRGDPTSQVLKLLLPAVTLSFENVA